MGRCLVVFATLMGVCLFSTSAVSSGTVSDVMAIPKANFAAADANADSALDRAEFEVFINKNADAKFGRSAKIRRFGAYKRVFKKVDSNKDGMVSWEEFAAAQQ